MSDINISIDSSDVKTVKQEIDSLRRSFTSAQASASVFSSAFESAIASQVQELDRVYGAFNRVARANQDVINGNLGISNSYKDAASSAEVFARAMLEADRRKADVAFALGAQRAKEEAKATEDLVRAQQRLANETEQLKRKYDATYAAASLYERTLQELDRALSLGALSANKHARAVEELKREYQDFNNNAAGANNRFAREVSQTSRGLNEFGFVAQQVGYQVGDFFVQVQSGTNWLVAFGQQATQLAGLLPGVQGAAIGIGISVATAIGATWMRASEDSKAAAKNLAEDATSALGEVKSKFEDVSEAAEKYAQAVALAGAIKDTGVTSYLSGLKEELSLRRELLLIEQARLEMKRLELQESIAANKAQIDAIAREVAARFESALGYATNEAERESIKQRILERTQEELDKNQELLLTQREQIATLGLVDNLLGRMGDATGKAVEEAVDLDKNLSSINEYLLQITGYDLGNIFSGAISKAGEFLTTLTSISAVIGSLPFLGAGSLNRDSRGVPTLFAPGSTATNAPPRAPSGIGGVDWGGGSLNRDSRGVPTPFAPGSTATNAPPRAPSGIGGVDWGGGVDWDYDKPKRGGGGGSKTDPWQELEEQIRRQKELLGLTGQEATLKKELWGIEDALGEDRGKYSDAQIQALAQQNLAVKEQLKLQEEADRQMQSLSDTIESSMSDAFMSMVDGTASVKDAFKSMAAAIIKQLFEVLVVQRLVGSWNASTGVGSGLVGAIMGLGGGKTVASPKTARASSYAASMGASGTTVIQNFNLAANGDESVKRIIKEEAPKLAKQAQAAVLDARRRGGAYGKAF